MSGVTAAVRELELPDRDAADEAARLVNPSRGGRATCQSAGVVIDDLLQQLASSRRFTLGVPRAVTVSRDGGRVLFLRTRGGEDPVTCLWGLDLADGAGRRERLLADPAVPWNPGPGNVPEAERVRRERAGETADGIVAYSADADCRTVVFALDGRLWVLHTEDQEQIMGSASHVSSESPPPFAAQLAEVEVDVDTGEVTVNKLVTAVDCGVAINPLTASGQVEGGMIQGLGYALTEELVLDETGRAVNARFGPYWIFRADDTPPTEVFLVQTNELTGPFGAKSVGEIGIDGVAPAVRNAVLDATGVAVNSLPLTPERVWRALRASPSGHR